ncbi:uncharacterized protein [Watersipora subatra]|uniref:uncharacterized protein n=1 Tax=Watersipora subatra TaxID=2589382 RepID=UPI00355BAC58
MSGTATSHTFVVDLCQSPTTSRTNAPFPQYHYVMPTTAESISRDSVTLHLLQHAVRCFKDNDNHPGIPASELCVLNQCKITKTLLEHIRACRSGLRCTETNCREYRKLITHWKCCLNLDCGVCLSKKEVQLANEQDPATIIDTFKALPFPANVQECLMNVTPIPPMLDTKGNVQNSIAAAAENKKLLIVPRKTTPENDANTNKKKPKTFSELQEEHAKNFKHLLVEAKKQLAKEKKKAAEIAAAIKQTVSFMQEEITPLFNVIGTSVVTVQVTESKVYVASESANEDITISVVRENTSTETAQKPQESFKQMTVPSPPIAKEKKDRDNSAEPAAEKIGLDAPNRHNSGSRKSLRLVERFAGSLNISSFPSDCLPSKRRRLLSKSQQEELTSAIVDSITEQQPANMSADESTKLASVTIKKKGRSAKRKPNK